MATSSTRDRDNDDGGFASERKNRQEHNEKEFVRRRRRGPPDDRLGGIQSERCGGEVGSVVRMMDDHVAYSILGTSVFSPI